LGEQQIQNILKYDVPVIVTEALEISAGEREIFGRHVLEASRRRLSKSA